LTPDLFYDPFADRCEKLEGLDYKFARDREPKNGNGNGIGSSGSANEDDSHHDDDQVSSLTGPAPGNTKGASIDLLFDWFGLACFANENKNCQ
jgi:hypothetical protein